MRVRSVGKVRALRRNRLYNGMMLYDEGEQNPYRSPETVGQGACEVAYFPQAPLTATLIRSSSLYRHLRLSGKFEAELEWNASGPAEYVAVNGRKVVSQMAYFQSVPHFDFVWLGQGRPFRVAVDVRVVWVYFTRAFQVTIDDEVIYREGKPRDGTRP